MEYIGILVGGYEFVIDFCFFGLESCIEYVVLVIFINFWWVYLFFGNILVIIFLVDGSI